MTCEQNSIRWKTNGQGVESDLTGKRKLKPEPMGLREEVRRLPEPLKGPGIEGTSNLQRGACKGDIKQKDELKHDTRSSEAQSSTRLRPPSCSIAPCIIEAKFKCSRQDTGE